MISGRETEKRSKFDIFMSLECESSYTVLLSEVTETAEYSCNVTLKEGSARTVHHVNCKNSVLLQNTAMTQILRCFALIVLRSHNWKN